MPEFYEYETSGARCLRSSPIASLIALVIIILGGIGFGLGTIFARKKLYEMLNVDHLLLYLDYEVYTILGATGIFVIIGYTICALSSGWTAKTCFEGSRKASCGRCLNITLLCSLIFGVIFWLLIFALLSYPVTSAALLLYRNNGPARSIAYNRPTGQDKLITEALPDRSSQPTVVQLRGSQDIMGNPVEIISKYFNFSEGIIDLSYYGLYDRKGFPLLVSSANIDLRIRVPLIFSAVALLGALFIMFGFLLMASSVAMNYAHLKEMRYYDPSDNGDETIRLRH